MAPVPPLPAPHHAVLRESVAGDLPTGMVGRPARPDGHALASDILGYLADMPLMNFTTRTPEGWPVGHCMHFAAVAGPRRRPVLYSFTHDNTRKLVNIPANPRVSGLFCREGDTSGAMLAYDGLAKVIDDDAEWEIANEAMYVKKGQQYTKLIRLDRQPALRIDLVGAVWWPHGPASEPVAIDWTQDMRAESDAA